MNRYWNLILLLLPLVLAITGALTGQIWCLYILVFNIIVIVGLVVCTNFIPKKLYPVAIFSIGLSLLYQSTLISNHLMGTDIHTEYYYFRLALENGWDRTIPHNYNSALGTVLIAPFLSRILHIEGVWIFKVIYPFLFAIIPVVLYFAFKRIMDSEKAFLASFFFMSVPVFAEEMVGNTRFHVAGLFLALLVLLVVKNDFNRWTRLGLGIALSIGLIVCYYTLGYIYMLYLCIGIFMLALTKLFRGIPKVLPLRGLLIVTVITIPLAYGYYSWAAGGEPARTIDDNVNRVIARIGQLVPTSPSETPVITDVVPLTEPPVVTAEPPVTVEAPTTAEAPDLYYPPDKTSNIVGEINPDKYPGGNLVKVALGWDFLKAGISGKIFRVFQFLTQLFVVVGFGVILWRRNHFPDGYIAFTAASALMLFGCITFMTLAAGLGVTRIYHITLFFLAPLFIIGGTVLLKPVFKGKTLHMLTLCVMLPYFLFTSGLIFEATQEANIEQLNIPFSAALSSHRIDIRGVMTDEDWEVIYWIVENVPDRDFITIYSDLHGLFFMYEQITPWIKEGRHRLLMFPQRFYPEKLRSVPNNSYIFLRQWNEENQEVTYWVNYGLRKSYSYEEIGMYKLLEGRKILYETGNARVYGLKE